ncbi:MAG: J domain-containing protein, partial [FCB group bacterium]|nr:J domain-containing protein [FCB group bacterium]
MTTDCEQLLGLAAPFTKGELNKKYKKLADKHHPDKHFTSSPAILEQAHEMMVRLNLCRDLLEKSIDAQDPSKGALKKSPVAGEGWTTFDQYISYIKGEPEKTVVWEQHLEGEAAQYQAPIQPLSNELK